MIENRAQIHMDEQVIDDNDLLRDLATWDRAKEAMAEAREEFTPLDKKVKGRIEELALPEGEYRCGRFRIAVAVSADRHVEFERKSRRQVRIRPAAP